MKENGLKSKHEMAKILSVSPRTLDNLLKDGSVPSIRIRNRRVFDPAEVIDALKAGSASPEKPQV